MLACGKLKFRKASKRYPTEYLKLPVPSETNSVKTLFFCALRARFVEFHCFISGLQRRVFFFNPAKQTINLQSRHSPIKGMVRSKCARRRPFGCRITSNELFPRPENELCGAQQRSAYGRWPHRRFSRFRHPSLLKWTLLFRRLQLAGWVVSNRSSYLRKRPERLLRSVNCVFQMPYMSIICGTKASKALL